jgi:hypothetical protein
LFTHPGAGDALRVGAANDVAIVTAGGSKVAVAPMLMSVGSIFMAGTVGDAYAPPVDESPDPPATLCVASPEYARLNPQATTMALPPTNPAIDLTLLMLIWVSSPTDWRSP